MTTSSENELTVFLPCRSGSERVIKKNTRRFADVKNGLIEIKLRQLMQVSSISKIVVSTDDEDVKVAARACSDERVVVDTRPEHLASSATVTEDIINYVPTIIPTGTVLWTHVTSPFITADMYEAAIAAYFDALPEYDSLMSVTKMHKFIWNRETAISYDRSKFKWPRTQTLEPLFEVNSGMFINSIDNYRSQEDRIGNKPYLYEMNEKDAFDIDWEIDFEIAKLMWSKSGRSAGG